LAVDACPLPEDSVLAEVALSLRVTGHWADIVDSEWRVVYTTDELRFGQGMMLEPVAPTLGLHFFGTERLSLHTQWLRDERVVEGYKAGLATIGDWVLADTPGGRDALRSIVDPRLCDIVDQITPSDRTVASANTVRSASIGLGRDAATMDMTYLRIRGADGRLAGTAIIHKPHVGMTTLAALGAMGDLDHFARMQSVAAPGRRPTAILFADLEQSSSLSKRLSTERYFALGRRITRVADSCIVEAGGITGRHVGDGVVAFFVAENFGSESAAAAAAIAAAQSLTDAIKGVALRADLAPEDLQMRFGLHWAATTYIGLIVTPGRTEVTALGDEVNETARIEACATGGRTLVSKPLIERLSPADAQALGVDTSRTAYVQLAQLSTATDKAQRDAPSIAVCEL
jgi:class 3 adenylate cyclase